MQAQKQAAPEELVSLGTQGIVYEEVVGVSAGGGSSIGDVVVVGGGLCGSCILCCTKGIVGGCLCCLVRLHSDSHRRVESWQSEVLDTLTSPGYGHLCLFS